MTDTSQQRTFMEFFAGGGMVRAGLGDGWHCVFANDIDPKKCTSYRDNWGTSPDHVECDVRALRADDLPQADLAWASFPCQDLSLAGERAGLAGARSGTFFAFWDLMRALMATGRGPRVIALENVVGALTSRGGRDFADIATAIADTGYRFGAMVVDAALFVPQSRPRLFVIAVAPGIPTWPAAQLVATEPFHPVALRRVALTAWRWRWWWLPRPFARPPRFDDVIEPAAAVTWHTPAQTARLSGMMSARNLDKVAAAVNAARATGWPVYGCAYKRTRAGVQRVEVRFDGVAGCLRTPGGGSSRQIVIEVQPDGILRSRLLSARETARLMGLPDTYKLPANYNEACHLTGDGVAVPVVRHLAHHLFNRLLPLP